MPELSTSKNPLIPGGKVYLADYDAQENPTVDERYTGNSQDLNINVSSETVQLFSAEDGLDELDDETVTRTVRTGTMTLANISTENLADFYIGDISEITQAAGSVVDEALTVKTDRHYQLGVSASNPVGAQDISNVVVTNDLGTVTYDVDVDYSVDLATGRLYIIPGGAIVDDQDILGDYDTAAQTWDRIASNSLKKVTKAFRFVSANAKGTNRIYYAPKCTLSPNGDAVLKQSGGAAYATLAFNLSFAKPDGDTAALYIDGRAVA